MEITPEIAAIIKEKLDAQKAELTATFEQDTAGLLKSKNDLLGEKKSAQEAEEQIRLEKARQSKDVATLSESYETKLQAERDAMTAMKNENAKLMNGIKQAEIHKISSAFVESNCVDDVFIRQAMNAEYSKRVDIRGGKAVVLDIEGNLTALSLDDLSSEFKSVGKYSNHIVVSKSSGGGATGSRQITGGASAVANFNGDISQKSAALAQKNPAFAKLPVR